ncbi:MAG: flagellin [Phycisphaerales bacterium]|nr:MAG: flagellin [Phycisphaerales bacterium]
MTRINTNVQSLIARRAIAVNNASLSRALERLSTGLRINSGRDDPAGLIASETLRSSIRAISTAIDNAARADTIVAVAEGGLQEVSALLLDLENLIDQAANEAGITHDELEANQLQIDSILQSINRLADATAFGDKKLLSGEFDFATSGININETTGAVLDHLDNVQINAAKIAAGAYRQINVARLAPSEVAHLSAVLIGTDAGGAANGTLGNTATIQIRGNYGSELLSFASGTAAASIVTAINDRSALTGVAASANSGATGTGPASISFHSTTYGSDAFVAVTVLENEGSTPGSAMDLEGVTGPITKRDIGVDGAFTINGTSAIIKGLEASARAGDLALDLTFSADFGGGTSIETSTSFEITGGGAVFSISPQVGLSGQESIGISEVSTAHLGNASVGFLATIGSGMANDLSSANFATAQRIVRAAINHIASLRGRLGGFQKDTLATTINSLTIARENVTAAESAIRDADFAVEASNLTRAQILVNSSTVVLQLANAQPQNTLALLG